MCLSPPRSRGEESTPRCFPGKERKKAPEPNDGGSPMPGWLAALVVGRDFAIVAGAVVYHNLVGPFDAAPSRLSKATTVIQLAFVLGELLRLSQWLVLPPLLRNVMIAITAAITIASGLHYIVVWGARARVALRARRGNGTCVPAR